ncbi:MAG: hypothetical protein AAGF59_14235 [Pseudomonadota bacterium]
MSTQATFSKTLSAAFLSCALLVGAAASPALAGPGGGGGEGGGNGGDESPTFATSTYKQGKDTITVTVRGNGDGTRTVTRIVNGQAQPPQRFRNPRRARRGANGRPRGMWTASGTNHTLGRSGFAFGFHGGFSSGPIIWSTR